MSKSVRMFAVIDGTPTEVGQCHAGQARLLRKKGLAEWREGKLWLAEPVVAPPVAPPPVEALVGPKLGPKLGARIPDWRWLNSKEYRLFILREAGVDTSFWADGDVVEGINHNSRPALADVRMGSVSALLFEFRRRLGLGHEMCAHDDPKCLLIGFLDFDASEYVSIPLTTLRETLGARVEEATAFGIDPHDMRDLFKTEEGRKSLFGDGDYGLGEPGGETTDVDDLPEIDWGELPPNVSKVFFPQHRVGLQKVVPPADLSSITEDRQLHMKLIREAHKGKYNFPLGRTDGWTHFEQGGANVVIPVSHNGAPHPVPTDTEVFGLFKREGGRLVRVWVQGRDAGWDVSVLQEDDTYQLEVEHTIAGAPAHEHIQESMSLAQAYIDQPKYGTKHEVSGWLSLKRPDAPAVFVMVPVEGSDPLQLVRTPWADLDDNKWATGLYRVVGDRMFRAICVNGASQWDESIRAPDGTYDLVGMGRPIDVACGEDGDILALAPSGFNEVLKDAEQKVREYQAQTGFAWTMTRY